MAEETIKLTGQEEKPLEDTVVKVYRCSKVVKGGRRFSFAALVVVGDRNGTVGVGYGKANEVPQAREKGIKEAKKQMYQISLVDGTLPDRISGKFGATSITLMPASPVLVPAISPAQARAVLEYAGVKNVLSKVYGSTGAKNVVKATLDGLLKLRNKENIEALRGVEVAAMKR